MQKIAMLVKADNLASGPETRIDSQYSLLSDRRSKKQLTQVLTKDPYRLDISLFFSLLEDLICDGRLKKPLECIIKCKMNLLCKRGCGITSFLTEIII